MLCSLASGDYVANPGYNAHGLTVDYLALAQGLGSAKPPQPWCELSSAMPLRLAGTHANIAIGYVFSFINKDIAGCRRRHAAAVTLPPPRCRRPAAAPATALMRTV